MKQKKIHFIGICGVAMSALALAFKKIGSAAMGGVNWQVTGSDVGFYPPVSTHLKDAGVDFYPGWHPTKVLENFKQGGSEDEIVVVGNVASSSNPEWQYVQEHKLNFKSYPELIKDYFIKQNSIVCAGTYGKSTSTAILTWILTEAGLKPSHMFGCIALNDLPSASLGNPDATAIRPRAHGREVGASTWSVLEGDEYKASRWDNGPKFSYYSPTHLLLTSIVWDHADVYPTEKLYIEAFQKLYDSVPSSGIKVISEKAIPVILSAAKNPPTKNERDPSASPQDDSARKPFISYGKTAGCDYVYSNVEETMSGVTFDILFKNETYRLSTPCLGEYMADNITGCFAMARECGITPEKIISAIKTFKGVKRRLEKRLENGITIFDTIAHSPTKAEADLSSLRRVYKNKIFAVFEPNSGNRERAALPGYAHAFRAADEVIIPRLTKIKTAPDKPLPVEGDELAQVIAKTQKQVKYFDEDAALLGYLKQQAKTGDVIVFLGSHGFRGMIEQLVSQLSS